MIIFYYFCCRSNFKMDFYGVSLSHKSYWCLFPILRGTCVDNGSRTFPQIQILIVFTCEMRWKILFGHWTDDWFFYYVLYDVSRCNQNKMKNNRKIKERKRMKKRPYTLTLFPTRQKSQNYCYRFAQSHTWTNTVAIVIILLNICCRNRNRDKNTHVTTHIISVQEVNGFE